MAAAEGGAVERLAPPEKLQLVAWGVVLDRLGSNPR